MQDEVNKLFLELARIATVKSPREIDLEARLMGVAAALSEYSEIVADCAKSNDSYETLLRKLTEVMTRLNAVTQALNKAVAENV